MKKAQTTYGEMKCDDRTLLCYQLYPDMFDFTKQVQVTTDHAQVFATLLSGVDAPKFEDNEKHLADLIARCERTNGWLESVQY